ncbi:zinc finger BED domain-containing protein DAYSLEEPER-like [Trifolium pratense]|uniref:zinc finger BED domain-containing protein DAYSLEEPER-like n=1 Tax=Trifolium pratense TaxID=57577 RepID=UPI001E695AE1|nr:zinc finger BED domain-containing protein DAYSLEEPER-like [Trifolium pratense]
MKFINWYAEHFFGSDEAKSFKENVNSSLNSLFNEYNGQVGESHASSQEYRPNEGGKADPYGFKPFYKSSGRNKADSEVTKYLDEILEEEGDLDVLIWWKDNCTRYPVLARIAREVLAIPVSTVASESAFSTGGRVLDAYRSSLSAITVEALICTQDWVKKKDHGIETSSLVSYDDLNTLQQLEQDFLSNLGSSSASTRLDDD